MLIIRRNLRYTPLLYIWTRRCCYQVSCSGRLFAPFSIHHHRHKHIHNRYLAGLGFVLEGYRSAPHACLPAVLPWSLWRLEVDIYT
jgi:hypothetical protein